MANNRKLSNSKGVVKVIPVTPPLMLAKDAYKYTGMAERLFKKEALKFGLSVYARGTKKTWYKVSEPGSDARKF